ncbi:hypothetical protein BO86DRAFT_404301 [Aspergillus japonicus CBS 114.51]|uniref:F-box domain-containing protein n=1 Tax=Aspergillus japonicus CBS 114.51 TaxID=1448312 RepID=A0A8T8WMH2_ASPJA|nr:hypothetical protein BO86DRAFT_404301 [Aspergillus japonicus CBS 114.51]RAH76832.1 hypothetical protein BO86DRAFT_404301 [Aspergillus japonicus CBS 114.51]
MAVCRRWRTAFGPLLYQNLVVTSAAANLPEQPPNIAVYLTADHHWLRACSTVLDSPENPTRHENDRAFQSGIFDLFETLANWKAGLRRHVKLTVCGRTEGFEPITWQARRRAFSEKDGALGISLPDVRCIDRLTFPERPKYHQIWVGAAIRIAQHCPTLSALSLGPNKYIRPDQLESIQARRHAISDGLKLLPPSLKEFSLSNDDEKPWKDALPALDVVGSRPDTMPLNLRQLSLSLTKLTLGSLPIDPDFLFPLDAQPIRYPRAKVSRGRSLRTGQWVVHPSPHEREYYDEYEFDETYMLCDPCEGDIERDILEAEHFHRLLIASGHAARRMPRLQKLQYALNHQCEFWFQFKIKGPERAEWTLTSTFYQPDHRVAEAWRCPLVELYGKEPPAGWEVSRIWNELSVTIAPWPPR